MSEQLSFIKICQQCPRKCILRETNYGIEFYACFSNENAFKYFIADFQSISGHLFVLSRTKPVFFSPVIEYSDVLCHDTEYAKNFCGLKREKIELTDSEFHEIMKGHLKGCEYYAEIKMTEWNEDKGD